MAAIQNFKNYLLSREKAQITRLTRTKRQSLY